MARPERLRVGDGDGHFRPAALRLDQLDLADRGQVAAVELRAPLAEAALAIARRASSTAITTAPRSAGAGGGRGRRGVMTDYFGTRSKFLSGGNRRLAPVDRGR